MIEFIIINMYVRNLLYIYFNILIRIINLPQIFLKKISIQLIKEFIIKVIDEKF